MEAGESVHSLLESRLGRLVLKLAKILATVGEILTFSYQFRYLLDEKFTYFSPYLHFFKLLVRRQNTYERSLDADDDDDELTFSQKAVKIMTRMASQYNIFGLFLFKVLIEWYYGARITQQ